MAAVGGLDALRCAPVSGEPRIRIYRHGSRWHFIARLGPGHIVMGVLQLGAFASEDAAMACARAMYPQIEEVFVDWDKP